MEQYGGHLIVAHAVHSRFLFWIILRFGVTQTLKEHAFEFTLPLRDAGE
jgi:hypothetical protein